MSAKTEILKHIDATVTASPEQAIAACQQAAALLGKKAEAEVEGHKVTVGIFPGLVRAMSKASPVVGVTITPGTDGTVRVTTEVERHWTSQSRVMLIPVGPKTLVGQSSFRTFLKALAQELQAIDAKRAPVAVIGA